MKSFLSSPASYFRQSQNISGCRISLGLFHMQNEYLIVAFLIKLLLAVKSRFISAHWLVAEDMQSLYFWWDWNYQTTVNSFSTVVLYTLYVSCTHTHTHPQTHKTTMKVKQNLCMLNISLRLKVFKLCPRKWFGVKLLMWLPSR